MATLHWHAVPTGFQESQDFLDGSKYISQNQWPTFDATYNSNLSTLQTNVHNAPSFFNVNFWGVYGKDAHGNDTNYLVFGVTFSSYYFDRPNPASFANSNRSSDKLTCNVFISGGEALLTTMTNPTYVLAIPVDGDPSIIGNDWDLNLAISYTSPGTTPQTQSGSYRFTKARSVRLVDL